LRPPGATADAGAAAAAVTAAIVKSTVDMIIRRRLSLLIFPPCTAVLAAVDFRIHRRTADFVVHTLGTFMKH